LFISNNAFVTFSQLKFDFENGNISDWQESISNHWEVSSINSLSGKSSLHHSFDNTSAGHDQISFLMPGDIDFSNNVSWSFKVRHNYYPSSSNNWSVFLVANKNSTEMYPGSSVSGFVVGVNYSGSDDILKLWKVEKGNINTVIETNLNWETEIGDSTALVKVSRSSSGNWVVEVSKECKVENLISVGSSILDEIIQGRFFGVFYKYSATQDMKLWLDDIEINAAFVEDNSGPVVDSISVLNNCVEIWFNEDIDSGSVDNANFIANPGQLMPEEISFTSDRSILLKFNNLENRVNYSLNINEIKDLHNNIITPVVKEFSYYQPADYDVLITEIMADPEPTVNLPNYEYLELYNNTDFQINLNKWILQSGENKCIFPSFTINPHDYAVICNKKALSSFIAYSKSIGLWTDSYFLNNSDGLLLLKEPSGKLISYAYYKTESYNDKFKEEGGWSLEMKDYKNPCGGESNWGFSENNSGGTPGKVNSISEDFNSQTVPDHLYTMVPDDTTIILHWSNMPGFSFIQNPKMFGISTNNSAKIYPESAEFALTNFPSTMLKVSTGVITDESSTIFLTNKMSDCTGATNNDEITIPFAKPMQCDSFDVVINEVLYSPNTGGAEFVELYNRSQKIIDAGNLFFSTLDTITGKVKSFCNVADKGFLFFPGEYILLTDNMQENNEKCKLALVSANFPSLTDDYGTIAIINKENKTIDKFSYSKKMHSPILQDDKGVSLERINVNWPTQSTSNWHSASQASGFSTPGYKNSQTYNDSVSTSKIFISPEVFSPNNDGNEDFLTIKINSNSEDKLLNINIYNSSGKLVKHLRRNQLLGVENGFTWDGASDDNRLLPSGIYILHITIQTEQGKASEYKKTCVLRR
jgi:gliding motility-associated-like protein